MLMLSGCSQYTRDIFWENKIKATPYAEADVMVRPELWRENEISYAWLGHATVLIDLYGTKIMTDPVLLARIGPPETFDNFFGIRRLTQLPMDVDAITDIDLVLVSHPHFDHLDLASLDRLSRQNDFDLILPVLTTDLLDTDLFDSGVDDTGAHDRALLSANAHVFELDWLSRAPQRHNYEDFTVTAFRVEHYGFADWGDRDVKRGFNGYLLQVKKNSKTIAFFGDTSYSRYRDEWGNILPRPESVNWRNKFPTDVIAGGIDLCIMPVGDAYYYWNHIGPEKALRLADELNCKHLLPIHYSTFILTPPEKRPVSTKEQLLEVLKKTGKMELVRCNDLQGERVFPEPGVSCVLP
ncbi:MAG: MBL fold metallo-hydrolase [Proteobacteria bacterium]|nr:MBL fold metallo-hydrolase [Pseudomonadota bacterium]